jgi:hypothetical protein
MIKTFALALNLFWGGVSVGDWQVGLLGNASLSELYSMLVVLQESAISECHRVQGSNSCSGFFLFDEICVLTLTFLVLRPV